MKQDMRSERMQYVDHVQTLELKIKDLEEMNLELVYKDFSSGQLEQELKKFQDMLKTSKSNETKLQNQLLDLKTSK